MGLPQELEHELEHKPGNYVSIGGIRQKSWII